MSAKFTPGPWIVTVEYGTHVIRGASVRHNENGVEFQWRDYVASTWGGEHADNARLIAAAPAMLDALQEALEYFEDREDVDDGPDGEPSANAEMSVAITLRAAIAKAIGEQS